MKVKLKRVISLAVVFTIIAISQNAIGYSKINKDGYVKKVIATTMKQSSNKKDDILNRIIKLEKPYDYSYVDKMNNASDGETYFIAKKCYESWDILLNQIWGILVDQLPKSQLKDLTNEQLNWINEKLEVEENLKNNSTSAEYIFEKLTELTIERCYYLADYIEGTTYSGNSVSEKKEYLDRLNALERPTDISYKNKIDGACEAEATEIAGKCYESWDILINQIWGVLTSQLSESEMKELTKEQLKWIEEKEEYEAQCKKNPAGASINSVMKYCSEGKANMTIERAYYLVNNYMY